VLELCRTLEEYANARCFLDQREFNENPSKNSIECPREIEFRYSAKHLVS
jgi:hypothetical protein